MSVHRRRVRPDILSHLEDSFAENEELGRRLAWASDPAQSVVGTLGLPPLAPDSAEDLAEAIDATVYDEP